MIGRARTGMGKTLAFALPIVERLMLVGGDGAASKQWGRAPKVHRRVIYNIGIQS